MLELYLDTADINAVERFHECMPIKGVTTNPTILAKSNIGNRELLAHLSKILGGNARFHVQVVSVNLKDMVSEAHFLSELPYDIVIKVPANETGCAAIKQIKAMNIPVLATAIYSAQQGFLAALSGADYLAPYVNRICNMGADGVGVVADLQLLIDQHKLSTKLLPASFKNSEQVINVLKLGVQAITLSTEIIGPMLSHPAVDAAVSQFTDDWTAAFGSKLSFEV